MEYPAAYLGRIYGSGNFYSSDSISCHKVSGGDIYLPAFTLAENINSGVFKISAHNAADSDVLGLVLDTCNQTAYSSDDHFDLDTCAACFDELIHKHLVGKGVELQSDVGFLSAFCSGYLPVDKLDYLVLERKGGYQQIRGIFHQIADRKSIEHCSCLRTDVGIGSHKGKVGVKLGCLFVVVSCTYLSDVLHLAAVLSCDKQQL